MFKDFIDIDDILVNEEVLRKNSLVIFLSVKVHAVR